jgi:hypothetical protein
MLVLLPNALRTGRQTAGLTVQPRSGDCAETCYVLLPQHFLDFFSLPQGHGSLRPTFGASRFTVPCGGQQLVSLQQEPSSVNTSLKSKLLLLLIFFLQFKCEYILLTEL